MNPLGFPLSTCMTLLQPARVMVIRRPSHLSRATRRSPIAPGLPHANRNERAFCAKSAQIASLWIDGDLT
jgi:hypothetical protein